MRGLFPSSLVDVSDFSVPASRDVPAIKRGRVLFPSLPRRAQPIPCSGRPRAVPSLGRRAGSADLVPTSQPLRSEQALGSVVPSPYPPPRLAVTLTPEVC